MCKRNDKAFRTWLPNKSTLIFYGWFASSTRFAFAVQAIFQLWIIHCGIRLTSKISWYLQQQTSPKFYKLAPSGVLGLKQLGNDHLWAVQFEVSALRSLHFPTFRLFLPSLPIRFEHSSNHTIGRSLLERQTFENDHAASKGRSRTS